MSLGDFQGILFHRFLAFKHAPHLESCFHSFNPFIGFLGLLGQGGHPCFSTLQVPFWMVRQLLAQLEKSTYCFLVASILGGIQKVVHHKTNCVKCCLFLQYGKTVYEKQCCQTCPHVPSLFSLKVTKKIPDLSKCNSQSAYYPPSKLPPWNCKSPNTLKV